VKIGTDLVACKKAKIQDRNNSEIQKRLTQKLWCITKHENIKHADLDFRTFNFQIELDACAVQLLNAIASFGYFTLISYFICS